MTNQKPESQGNSSQNDGCVCPISKASKVKKPPKKPGFSRKVANKYGVSEAIVLRFLAHKVREAAAADRNYHNGFHWYYESVNKLISRLPYFRKSTLADVLGRLEQKGLIHSGRFNKWKRDRTKWYTMTESVMDGAEDDVIYFDEAVAIRQGIC